VESIKLSKNITTVGDQAFYPTSVLLEFKVDEANTTFYAVDGVLFKNVGADKHLWKFPQGKSGAGYTIPTGTTHLAQYCFGYARNVSSLIIPEGVVNIQYRSFYVASNLTSLTLPQSLTTIGNQTFAGADKLEEVHMKASIPPTG